MDEEVGMLPGEATDEVGEHRSTEQNILLASM